jgi:hypothetical protein
MLSSNITRSITPRNPIGDKPTNSIRVTRRTRQERAEDSKEVHSPAAVSDTISPIKTNFFSDDAAPRSNRDDAPMLESPSFLNSTKKDALKSTGQSGTTFRQAIMKNQQILHSEITEASKSVGKGVSKKASGTSFFFRLPVNKSRL